MSSQLDHIKDWDVRAEHAYYRVGMLAGQCGITERQLRRYFRTKFGRSPHSWISAIRFRNTLQLLSQGRSLKEAASNAGYSHYGNFSRDFKKLYKANPSSLKVLQSRASGLDNVRS